MTRDEWIKARAEDRGSFGPLGPPSYAAWDGSDYDHLCRLIDSRIAAALENRDAEAMASASAAWSAKEHADAAALAAKSAEPPTYSRREPVADEDRPPTGERFGARIHNSSKDGKFLVDVSSASLCCTGRWYYYAGERGKGNFPTEAEARAALATAPPPPGWVEQVANGGEKRSPGPELIAGMKQLRETIGRDRFIAECRKVLDDYAILAPNKLRGPDVVGRVCDRLADAILSDYDLTRKVP